jgi:hypothetical protein
MVDSQYWKSHDVLGPVAFPAAATAGQLGAAPSPAKVQGTTNEQLLIIPAAGGSAQSGLGAVMMYPAV